MQDAEACREMATIEYKNFFAHLTEDEQEAYEALATQGRICVIKQMLADFIRPELHDQLEEEELVTPAPMAKRPRVVKKVVSKALPGRQDDSEEDFADGPGDDEIEEVEDEEFQDEQVEVEEVEIEDGEVEVEDDEAQSEEVEDVQIDDDQAEGDQFDEEEGQGDEEEEEVEEEEDDSYHGGVGLFNGED